VLDAPDRNGAYANVVLGCSTLDDYRASPYVGAAIGRFAGRISGGRFVLDGVVYEIPCNDSGARANALHGGPAGFALVTWSVVKATESAIVLRYVSPDGDQGFPGQVDVTVTYRLGDDALRIDYTATTDAPTVVNLTNHAYFNLAGARAGSVLDHELTIEADAFLPTDAALIPTGEVRAVAGTPFDFRRPTAIGARIDDDDLQLAQAGGYDHTWVVRGTAGMLRPCAFVREPRSGRTLACATDQPGVQFYSGNFLDAVDSRPNGLHRYAPREGFTLETQHFPDSPNHPAFPPTVMRPGATFRSTTVYRFGVA